MTTTKEIVTDIPARLDRLPWSRFHALIVAALGITWILDGLEVTIVGSLGPILQDARTFGFTEADVGLTASCYVAGAVLGALFFGWLTDRFGRSLIFMVTLGIYLLGCLLTAFSWDFWSFAAFRLITGFGIGGEYAAINSAIDELMPARLRGRIDLMVNGSYWGGAALGAGATALLLTSGILPIDMGWRLAFGAGAVVGLFILLLRRFVPESPRWQVTHGYEDEARQTIEAIEAQIDKPLAPVTKTLTVQTRKSFGFKPIFASMLGQYRSRSILSLVLMVSQAFLFNAVFFTYSMVLTNYYNVPAINVGHYIIPLTLSNLMGPFVLGPLFDTLGRKRMITLTYGATAMLLFAVAWMFNAGMLTAWSQTAWWMAIFFVASAAASSAYLTASEIFPLETRAMAIATFYALGTLIGGVAAPYLFGLLIGSGDHSAVAMGYVAAGILMMAGAICEVFLGVEAAGKSLEDIAPPLASAPKEGSPDFKLAMALT